jgi:hypothetical protein
MSRRFTCGVSSLLLLAVIARLRCKWGDDRCSCFPCSSSFACCGSSWSSFFAGASCAGYTVEDKTQTGNRVSDIGSGEVCIVDDWSLGLQLVVFSGHEVVVRSLQQQRAQLDAAPPLPPAHSAAVLQSRSLRGIASPGEQHGIEAVVLRCRLASRLLAQQLRLQLSVRLQLLHSAICCAAGGGGGSGVALALGIGDVKRPAIQADGGRCYGCGCACGRLELDEGEAARRRHEGDGGDGAEDGEGGAERRVGG